MASKRIVGIDYLKFIALFLVLNSHMEKCYHPHDFLATGGAIGDALFFFCSGFTLFLGKQQTFFNYYKKRFSRIYPAVLIVGILSCIFYNTNRNICDLLLNGGGWFVSCIMLYYIPLYFIRKYLLSKMYYVWFIMAALILSWYYLFPIEGFIYANATGINAYFRWLFYFIFMLQGAIIGVNSQKYKYEKNSPFKLVFLILIWYMLAILRTHIHILNSIQYLSLLPLLGISYYSYNVCCSEYFKRLYQKRFWNQVIYVIGGLCLESYLVQNYIFTDRLNFIFPLNIPIIMIVVLLVSYIVHTLSNLLLQTFQIEDYNLKRSLLWSRDK